jgi:Fe-S cluster assembly ATPase SufC
MEILSRYRRRNNVKELVAMAQLVIKGLQVSVEGESGAIEILRGVDLTINSGEVHAIMGPNGSGKSTLAYSIAGHPKYNVTGGSVTLDGVDVLEMREPRQDSFLRCNIRWKFQEYLFRTF